MGVEELMQEVVEQLEKLVTPGPSSVSRSQWQAKP